MTIAGPARPLRAVVIGAGTMGQRWIRTVIESPDAELVGVVDLSEDRARAAAGSSAAAVGTDLRTVVERTAPDFVIDVTIPEAHHPTTLLALELGLPVLGEKPLAATLTEAVDLVAAAERSGQLFMVSQSRRYNAGLFALKDHVAELGDVGAVTTEFFKAVHFGGFRDEMAHPLILDMAIHQFDAVRFLTGADPVAVYCEEHNPPWSWYRGDAMATAVFELTGGIRYTYTGSWCSGGHETSWNGRWRVTGAAGTALWDGEGALAVEAGLVASSPGDSVAPSPGHPVAPSHRPRGVDIAGSLAEFIDALRTGAAPMGECHDNLKSLAMVHGAIASAQSGRRVAIDDLLAEARQLAT